MYSEGIRQRYSTHRGVDLQSLLNQTKSDCIYRFPIPVYLTGVNLTLAVREAGVSRHIMGAQLRVPLKPLNTIVFFPSLLLINRTRVWFLFWFWFLLTPATYLSKISIAFARVVAVQFHKQNMKEKILNIENNFFTIYIYVLYICIIIIIKMVLFYLLLYICIKIYTYLIYVFIQYIYAHIYLYNEVGFM